MASAALTTCARMVIDEKVWYVLGEWNKTHFQIYVSDSTQAWEGEVSADEVDKRASRWDWTPLKYVDAAVEHLREQQGEAKASYQMIKKGEATLQLAWDMKQVGDEGLPLRCVVNLQKSDDPGLVVRLMLDYMHRKRADLEMDLSRKSRAFRGMKEELDKCSNQARSFADEKAHLESDLYKKFAMVLNSKKAKIRELKAQLASGGSLAIVPAGDGTDEGEATENERSEGGDSGSEAEDERNDDRGMATGGSDDDRGMGTGVNDIDRGKGEEPNGATRDGEGREAGGSIAGDDRGQREMEVDAGARDRGGGSRGVSEGAEETKRKGEEAKPQASNASALLGGGSTYTSGPRKRRR